MKQLVDAAITMDYKGVFHRDIKPHNILIETSSEEPRVRYIDFGCGVTFTPGQRFRRKAGMFSATALCCHELSPHHVPSPLILLIFVF